MVNLTYRLVPANFRMVLNVSFNVLPPDDWVIVVRPKELFHVFSPGICHRYDFSGMCLRNGLNFFKLFLFF